MPDRIGVIGSGTNFNEWRRASAIPHILLWHLHEIVGVESLRHANERLSSVLCLPFWHTLPNAHLILEGAMALLVGASQSAPPISGVPYDAFMTAEATTGTILMGPASPPLMAHAPGAAVPTPGALDAQSQWPREIRGEFVAPVSLVPPPSLRPPPVGDNLRDAMQNARTAIERGNEARRARTTRSRPDNT